MTGLNLESFLRLIRADLGAWTGLGAIAMALALMVWTSWGARRALWKCLVLSIVVHAGLLAYGGFLAILLSLLRIDQPGSNQKPTDEVVERVRIAPMLAEAANAPGTGSGPARKVEAWDRDATPIALADPGPRRDRPVELPAPTPIEPPRPAEPLAAEAVVADSRPPDLAPPEMPAIPRTEVAAATPDVMPVEPDPTAETPAPGSPGTNPPATVAEPTFDPAPNSRRAPAPRTLANAGTDTPPAPREPIQDPTPTLRSAPTLELPPPPVVATRPAPRPAPVDVAPPTLPDDTGPTTPTPASPASVAATDPAASPLPDRDVRRPPPRPGLVDPGRAPVATPERLRSPSPPIEMARVTPSLNTTPIPAPRRERRRPLSEVPQVYRSRLDPNRAALAQRAGASTASEQAVERALDWLSRHQDADGRWDAATGRLRDGSTRPDDDSYLAHCPPGDLCLGECFYWEADTALTGLSLLAYLGAGYTHVDGKYASTVGRGLDFLVASQKPDGDLRGPSVAVGMYCHAMATLALAEAFALTGDGRFRDAAEKGINFLVRARAADRQSWRYLPGEPIGDTSILGWVVLAMRTGKVSGIAIPDTVGTGIKGWLDGITAGNSGGLARYQPRDQPTASMTAEAWACRQFLGIGGPGAASDEAAAYLMANGPARGEFNIYYWYYGTLAMFQRGGSDWQGWNAAVRDRLVKLQQTSGHRAGSWDADSTAYGTRGGRIYTTALATLTLEVYYRYLRLNEAPPSGSPAPVIAPRPIDPGTRRTGVAPSPAASRNPRP